MIRFRSHATVLLALSVVFALFPIATCQSQSTETQNTNKLIRTEKYVRELVAKFDANDDKVLDAEETAKMRTRLSQTIDRNSDGLFSQDELFFHYSGGKPLPGSPSPLQELSTIDLDLRVYRVGEETQLPEERDRWSEVLTNMKTVLSIQTVMVCGRESSFQVGQTLPRVVGQSINGRQATSRQINMIDVGSILKVTPLNNGEDFILNLQLEHSGVQPTDDPLLQPVERLQVNQNMLLPSSGDAFSVVQQGSVRWIVLAKTK